VSRHGRFRDRVVIVTGGGAGLGRAISVALAEEGALVVVADRDAAAARATCAAVSAAGGSAQAEAVDVLDRARVEAMVADVMSLHGRIDGLVNNAGVLGPPQSLLETDDAAVDRVMQVNVRGVFTCTRAAAAHMRPGAAIVTLASLAGKEGPRNLSIYSASKAAVIAATKSWSKELVDRGIRANCVAPTLIADTGMKQEMPVSLSSDSIARIPMGRPATPQEVARVVLFLLSDEASFVTGACYDASGGRATY